MSQSLDIRMKRKERVMRKLIINADDLGISSEVNKQIENCVRHGVVTSSSILANAPAFEEGVIVAKKNARLSVGVHLNLIEFTPLTNIEVFKNHGIVSEDGNFIDGAIFVAPIDDELKEAIFQEWDAQITKVEQAGINPTHCDSHEHTHTITVLREVLCRVMNKHHITKVRRKGVPSIRIMLKERKRPSVVLDKSKAVQPPKHNVLYRRLHLFAVKWDCYCWNRSMSKRYVTTDCFYAFRNFYEYRNIINLGGNNAVIELMCHPGHKSYQSETDNMMKDASWMGNHYKLISYWDL